jgi:16S rRNA (uracil1498-N3)-methyltransferase
MDLVVQKATELGVAAIVPVITARSVVKLDSDQAAKRREHWLAIAINACEQCGRATLPEIAAPVSLEKTLITGNGDSPHYSDSALHKRRYVLDPQAETSLIAAASNGKAVSPKMRSRQLKRLGLCA